ncbi:MAG: prenyltransferase/squalene oxidase repeat-containing protein [Planctomycetota bacterium]
MRTTASHVVLIVAGLFGIAFASSAAALDEKLRAEAELAVERGLAYLASTQNEDGSWSPEVGPAITGLALRGFLENDGSQTANRIENPAAQKALAYVLDRVQPDGSIRDGEDGILANYNTAICVSALTRLRADPVAIAAIQGGVRFLRDLQWQIGMTDPDGNVIDEDHPWFGGAGYGNNGRPDLSNTQMMLEALYEAGVPADDPAFQRALVFITRLQGTAANDYWPEGTIVQEGGFIYATSVNKDLIGVPQSMASPEMTDEARAGRPVSGLRNYGSMTYAGFKSYLYADLKADDQRVHDALSWLKANYTLDRNPGMPAEVDQQGLFYYYLVQGRALAAYGADTLEVTKVSENRLIADSPDEAVRLAVDVLKEGGITVQVDWRANLIEALLERQDDDGNWANTAPRWMETNPQLVTAYAVLTLQEALE